MPTILSLVVILLAQNFLLLPLQGSTSMLEYSSPFRLSHAVGHKDGRIYWNPTSPEEDEMLVH